MTLAEIVRRYAHHLGFCTFENKEYEELKNYFNNTQSPNEIEEERLKMLIKRELEIRIKNESFDSQYGFGNSRSLSLQRIQSI